MARKFKTVDYDATLNTTIRLGDAVPPDHLARFVVEVIALLDLSHLYARYGSRGAPPYAPEILLALLFYGYATGVFSSRKIEKATYSLLPFRFIAGNRHPDHDTIANFRKTFLPEIEELFVQILLIAYQAGVFKLGNISIDGTKIQANASKSHAVSYKRLFEIEEKLQQEVEQLIALAEHADKGSPLPDDLNLNDEIVRRQKRLSNLAEAKAVIETRAQERYEIELGAFKTNLEERAEKEQRIGRKLPGRKPSPPKEGARDKDQYNFTDPDSQIMKNSNNNGFDQHYNAQIAVDQDSLLIVGHSLSNHANDQAEVEPTLDTIPIELGTPRAAALDNGYFSADNVDKLESRGIEPYIATGRISHCFSLPEPVITNQSQPNSIELDSNSIDPIEKSIPAKVVLAPEEESTSTLESKTEELPLEETKPVDSSQNINDIQTPESESTVKLKMASKLRTEIGQAIYRLRKCTVEPVIGIIKETIGFRQFSLRGLEATAGEWTLTCLAFNLKRLHNLTEGQWCSSIISPTGC